jgi:hypothetical protein
MKKMSMEIFKKPEMAALEEASHESVEKCEEYKKCILRKVDEFLRAFNMDTETKDEGLIEKIEKFNTLMKNTNATDITKDSHLGQILGTMVSDAAWIVRREKLRNDLKKPDITEEERVEIEKKIEIGERPLAEMKQALSNYITMCLSDNNFRSAELSARVGFWENKAVTMNRMDTGQDTSVGIAEMEAPQFVNYSWEHFKNKKVSKEDFDLAA